MLRQSHLAGAVDTAHGCAGFEGERSEKRNGEGYKGLYSMMK